MKTKLTISQRIVAAIIYTIIFIIICFKLSGGWSFISNSESKYNLIFLSGSLLLILGAYVAEPFFTKPTDALANSIAVLLALLGIKDKTNFIGYWHLFISSIILILLSIILFFLYSNKKTIKIQKLLTKILSILGQSNFIFSAMYIATLFSFFKDKPIDFTFFLTFWIIFITNIFVEKLIIEISQFFKILKTSDDNLLGEAIGCENPFLYKVEIDYFKHKKRDTKKGELVYISTEKSCGYVGITVEEKYLLNKKWISIYLLQKNNLPIKINLKNNEIVESSKSIFSKDNSIYYLDLDSIENDETKRQILENNLYKNRDHFVGYVSNGSNIQKLKFITLIEPTNKNIKLLKEGSIVKTNIKNKEVLYQIINGETIREELDKHNTYGYLSGIAHKLGEYNEINERLEVTKWLPNIYSPIFFYKSPKIKKNPLKVGSLPGTNLEIAIKDINSLVTHNTAILGILGIGKSCLTFELLKKIVENTNTKIICIDITNEYKKELPKYIDQKLIKEELSEESLSKLRKENKNGNRENPNSWGNEVLYKKLLSEEIKKFNDDDQARIFLINPDWHQVSKAGAPYKITFKTDLSIAEKTRIISEKIFMLAKNIWDKNPDVENSKANFLLVFEEAHSLIPEWNSTANSGDQSASNGTAKVILQGRKYGFGSLVVTQRTANISKSILNQCNTIFALRVFDDTGKQFLGNYIGNDYSNTLPTLEERSAIVVGKALKLRQPIIIQLNDKSEIINS